MAQNHREIKMTAYPLALSQIVSWYRSKQSLLAGSAVYVSKITERTEDLPAAAADFNGVDTRGRINGWVSGEFDFEAVRVSDGKDILWRHIDVSAIEALEDVYVDFIHSLSEPGPSGTSA